MCGRADDCCCRRFSFGSPCGGRSHREQPAQAGGFGRGHGCCTHCSLGVAARLQKDIEIEAKDGLTGELIHVKTFDGKIGSLEPATAVAWFGQKKGPDGQWVSAGCFNQGRTTTARACGVATVFAVGSPDRRQEQGQQAQLKERPRCTPSFAIQLTLSWFHGGSVSSASAFCP
jgi:hypothetical protein